MREITQAMDILKGIFKKDFIIGLDMVGPSSVKLAQFINREDGLHLVRADLREIKQSQDDAINEKETVSAIRYLFRDIDAGKSKIIVNINCPQTAIKKITAPYMPKAELGDGIRLEAKNYFHFPVEQSRLDFEILGDIFEKGIRKYEVLVALSPVKTVDNYLSLLGKAGIKPDAFVPSPYALQKLTEIYADSKEGQAQCFIDIGEHNTELIIAKGGYLMFSRKIPVAGSDFTKAMTGVLLSDRGKTQLSLEEAERIKRNVGIPSEVESKIIDEKISTAQILSMLRASLEQLVSEIGRCFDYYREETGDSKINSVVLFGGGASLGGLRESLSEALGINVRLGDSLEGIKIEPGAIAGTERLSHRLALAVGAALAGKKGINLLPPEMKERTTKVVKRGTMEAAAAALFSLSLLTFIGLQIKLSNFQKRISAAQLGISILQPELKKAETEVLAQTLLEQEPYWGDIFKELSNLISAHIYLTNISMKNNLIIIKGVANSSDEGERLVSDFILALEKGIFNNVKLIGTKDLSEGLGTEFELKCWIDYE